DWPFGPFPGQRREVHRGAAGRTLALMGWETRQKDLVLILARDMAARLATPMFVVDAVGTLVFFNEAAEALLGGTFADIGGGAVDGWGGRCGRVGEDGTPIERKAPPRGIALREGRPAHRALSGIGADGVTRRIPATAIPLQRHPGQTVGAVALFW